MSILMIAVSGCNLQTRDQIQQQQQESQQMQSQLTVMQKTKADNDMRLTEMQADMRSLTGRVDALEHNGQQDIEKIQSQIDDLKKNLADQTNRLQLIEQHFNDTETKLMAAIQGAVNNSKTANVSASEASARENTKEAKKASGGPTFEEAESLFSNKDYKKAIVKYQSYRDKNPKGSKTAEATYKIGVCFSELGAKKEAREFYEEILEKYPGTAQAKKAKFRLSQLNK